MSEISQTINGNFQFIIALIMVSALVVFLGILYATQQFGYAETLIATFGTFVSLIIGFYFGQKPIQNLTQQVATVSGTNQSFTEKTLEAGDIIEHQRDIITNLAQEITSLKQDIENLNNQK
jgi:hypothetical protein